MTLAGRHPGETATIVGTGPSLLRLTTSDFGAGPVIALNDAVLALRRLRLPNRMYVMQKDGCIPHGARARVPILRCVCPGRMPQPRMPEEVILSAAESSRCWRGYPRRHVLDVESLGLRWATSSTPVAVKVAELMGCASVRMLAHDAHTRGDSRRVTGSGIRKGAPSYARSGLQAQRLADRAGLAMEWVA